MTHTSKAQRRGWYSATSQRLDSKGKYKTRPPRIRRLLFGMRSLHVTPEFDTFHGSANEQIDLWGRVCSAALSERIRKH